MKIKLKTFQIALAMSIAFLGFPDSTFANLSATVTDASGPCPLGDDGQIDLHVNGGTAPFTYFWTGPNGFTATTEDLEDVCPGLYQVEVTDAACGTAKLDVSVCYGNIIINDLEADELPCPGTRLGEIFIEEAPTGGTGPYTYEWDNGTTGIQVDNVFAGTYCVTVTDAMGCTGTGCLEVANSPSCSDCENVGIYGMFADLLPCGGQSNGAISVSEEQGSNPIVAYTWSTGETTQTNTLSGLAAGIYCVTLTDMVGCTGTSCLQLNEGSPGTFGNFGFGSVEISPASGPSASDGYIVVQMTNGQAPYHYSWTGPDGFTEETQNIFDLGPGEYCLTVNDASGCRQALSCFVVPTNCPEILLLGVQHNGYIDCHGGTGTFSAAVSSLGAQPYTFLWSNGSNTQTIEDIPAGLYCVTVTDANGCSENGCFTMTEPDPIQVIGTVAGAGCDGESGSITLEVSGGSPPYQYDWIDGSTLKDRVNLSAGNYCVTVTDSKQCTGDACFPVEPSMFDLVTGSTITNAQTTANIVDFNCTDAGCNGAIDLDIHPLASPTFLWSNGETTQNIGNLCEGIYFVTVTDGACEEEHWYPVINEENISCGVSQESFQWGFGDGSYFYVLPFFILKAIEVDCFDSDCGLVDNFCSEIWIDPGNIPSNNCWTGTVTITYPDGSQAVFKVQENNSNWYSIEWVSGDDKWDVPDAGTYDVGVSYVGTGESQGINCSTVVHANWYGGNNYNDAIGFNSGLWWDTGDQNIPDAFLSAYYGAWRCQTCKPDSRYIFNDEICKSFGNYQFTWFKFVPDDYYADDPCDNGGTITILDFNDNGLPTVQNIPVPAGIALNSLPGAPPLGNGDEIHCEKSGWCLFDAMDIPAYLNADLERPLLATYGLGCVPLVFDEPGVPNPNPCLFDDDCPLGFGCDPATGDCIQPCNGNNDCMLGECVENECVIIDEMDCYPDCPSGYSCHEGDCYINVPICGFSDEVNGQGGENTYNFFHEVPPGVSFTYTLNYKTYNIPDEFFIYHNDVPIAHFPTPCVPTGTEWADPPFSFTIVGGGKITITVKSCGSPASKFKFEINCENYAPPSPPDQLSIRTGAGVEVSLHPNPFDSELDLTYRNEFESFEGQLVIFDNTGREVLKKGLFIEKGQHHEKINGLGNLPDGLYLILLKKNGEVYASEKVVKSR